MTLHGIQPRWTFARDWDSILEMHHEAVLRRAEWRQTLDELKKEYGKSCLKRQDFIAAVRNYNALRGVVQTLEWVMDSDAPTPLD